MKFWFIISFIITVFSLSAGQAGADEISVLTTTWLPFAYEEKGEARGLSSEIVRAALDRAEIIADIEFNSWNRAIITAKARKNILIYPLMRIKEREGDFIWVAPIFNAKLSLFKLKTRKDITVKTLEDAKKYSIGVLKGAAMHQYLLSKGFEDDKQLQIFYSNRKSIELLFRERLDLTAENPLVFSYEVKQLNLSKTDPVPFSMDKVEELLPLIESKAYMAFGKGSSQEYVLRLQTAIKDLEADGTIGTIFAKYR
ncbi:substrate-binding periplasmic protein [Desulfospira joergensenii]|uniref:substrate-binding periplasmic protein n=1 Tax=Desulfospira joergensenii TaxID=53329 RepID=UPI0003B3010D|nr:transporter substrate-binding domain-containing protein [Desulfospira joergensenii]